MKSLVGKLGVLVLLATASSAIVAGCSSSVVPGAGEKAAKDGSQGEVTLGLLPVTGVALNSVHYVVANAAGGVVSEGDLPTAGDAKDFSFGLSLPVGSGYTIALSAVSADPNDNITCGGSYGPFNVLANTSAALTLTLTCHDDTNGQTVGNIGVQTDACPRVLFDYVVAAPAALIVGKTAALGAKAHDLDGKTLTYSWKIANPSVGVFSPVTGAASTFTCESGGPNQVVTVTADNGECKKSLTTTLSCRYDDGCGNGVVDPGETCDKALDPNCPADCTYVCGDGVAEAPAEECDPGSPTNPVCDEFCHLRSPDRCGNGGVDPGEACDHDPFTNRDTFPAGTPAGSICSLDCKTITVTIPIITCGDGVVEGAEACDDGTGLGSPIASPKCSNKCEKISTQACVDCENAGDCFETVNNCLGNFTPFTDAQQSECFDVMKCIERSNCLDGTGTLGSCYCGSIKDTAACAAAPFTGPGSPDGACVKEIQAGFPGLTTNSAILGGLTAGAFPSGAAMGRLNCQKIANHSACLIPCGLNAGGPPFP
ncbi:MAG TPA: hypothetical protein VER96_31095 [Polyangiaceae bacterium]|nr:hypothetical protein [Polyangiaceae bacterium]